MALPSVQVSPSSLLSPVLPKTAPRSQTYRRYYGNNVDLAAIQNATRNAEVGLMSDLTDLSTEAMSIDPHLCSVLGKRFGAVQVATRNLKPASGPDVNKEAARLACRAMTVALANIRCLPAAIFDMAWALFDGRAAREIHWGPAPYGIGSGPFRIRWTAHDLAWIHPRNLSFGAEREVRYIDPMRQQGWFSSTDGFALRECPYKFLSWTPRLFREYPEREGLAPRAMYWTFFKRFSWRMRMLLTELFGVPWRIVSAKEGAIVSGDQLAAARNAAQALGAETTAQLDPGIELEVVMPDGTSGDLFKMTSEDVDGQMSKLVLGQGGTTDGMATGLNSNQTSVMKDEQVMIAVRDCTALAEVLTEQLVHAIALVNWGPEAAALYCPTIEIDASMPRDRAKDLTIIEKAVAMRLPVPLEEARSAAGLRLPDEDEELLAAAPAVGADGAPAAGGVEITPSDLATIITVDEGRASAGLPPLGGPDGAMTITAFKAKYSAVVAEAAAADDGTKPGAAPPPGALPPGAPPAARPTAPPPEEQAAPPPKAGMVRSTERVLEAIRAVMAIEECTREEAIAILRAERGGGGFSVF